MKNRFENIEHDKLQELINESTSISEVLRKLGLKDSGGNHRNLSKFLGENTFDTKTLVGRSIFRGNRKQVQKTLLERLVVNGENNSHKLKTSLFLYGVKEKKCECCGITEWNGQPITFELHHINGVHNDNRLENLIILCPNCHSQTPNFRGKNSNSLSEQRKLKNLQLIAANDKELKLPTLIQQHLQIKETKTSPSNYKRSIVPKIPKDYGECLLCGCKKEKNNSKFCSYEHYMEYQKRNIPSKEHILEEARKVHSLSELNRVLGCNVTDNNVKKWCQNYGIYDIVKKSFIKRTFTIYQYTIDGKFIKEWNSAEEIKRTLKCSKSKVTNACRMQVPFKNFIWSYTKNE